ncbi:MAG: transposase [Verrucomicrobia bacterium]|nr:transposase [Verrucomicrobiota bacterium]MDA1065442.1 transposase [Verrucomicrobiota bacterium]
MPSNDASKPPGSWLPQTWQSRGYLPHFQSKDHVQHVTVHLADSLPTSAIQRIEELIKEMPEPEQPVERRKQLQDWMDAGHGSCVLEIDALAKQMEETLLHFDGLRYRTLAWVIMPNHFHILFQPTGDWLLSKIVASWKKFSARAIRDWLKANQEICDPRYTRLLNCKSIWQPEYFDRYIRNSEHLKKTEDYIHQNPVKAGLVAKPRDWPWSSASLHREHDTLESQAPD